MDSRIALDTVVPNKTTTIEFIQKKAKSTIEDLCQLFNNLLVPNIKVSLKKIILSQFLDGNELIDETGLRHRNKTPVLFVFRQYKN